MVNDPVADLIIQMKNAGMVGKLFVDVPYSRFKHAIADALNRAGFVGEVDKKGKGVNKTLRIELIYLKDGSPKIKGVKRISKPGRRLYKGVKHIFPVRYGFGVAVFSTPKGVLTDKEARERNVGGEELFRMW